MPFSLWIRLFFLYHLFALLTITRYAGHLPCVPTELLTTLLHPILCSLTEAGPYGLHQWIPLPSVFLLGLTVGRRSEGKKKSKIEVFILPWMCHSFPFFVRTWTDPTECFFICLKGLNNLQLFGTSVHVVFHKGFGVFKSNIQGKLNEHWQKK